MDPDPLANATSDRTSSYAEAIVLAAQDGAEESKLDETENELRARRARREASFAYFDDGTGKVNASQLWRACKELGDPISYTESKEVTEFTNGVPWLDHTTWYIAMTFEQGAEYSTRVKGRESGIDFVTHETLLANNVFANPGTNINPKTEVLSLHDRDDLREAALEIVACMKHNRQSPAGTGLWLSETKFIIGVSLFLCAVLAVLSIISVTGESSVGSYHKNVFWEAILLFVAELVWEAFLSWLVLKYHVKINYTRKMGHLLRVPKYFFADLVPSYESTAISMVFSLTVNQIIYMIIFATWMRRKSTVCDFLFLSQNRKEDRPDTLIYQVTEDLLRFAVYFPFKLVVSKELGKKAIVFIPIIINTIGDGLAEPVGVTWGKHKYRTRSLYANGKFWSGSFVRSYEGSAVVVIVSAITVAAYYNTFDNDGQFAFCLIAMPPLMTLAEAYSPHTNDGPFLALVGCGILWISFGLL